MKHLILSLVLLVSAISSAFATTYYLKNNNPTQNWNDPCNWYTDPNNVGGTDCLGFPGANDDVIINGHSFIQLQNPTTISSLHMDNGYGNIGGNFDLTVVFDARVEGMTIQNKGKIFIHGNLYLTGGTLGGSDTAFVYGNTYFDGAGISARTLVLLGNGYWSQNNIGVSYNGKLVVSANSTLQITNNGESVTMSHSSGGYFYNYGHVSKNSSKNLTLGAYNFSTGGSFYFSGGKTTYSNNLTYTDCTVTLDDRSRIDFLNGNHFFYNTDVNSEGYILAAGNLFDKQFDANCTFTNDTLQLASGTWKFYIPLSIPNLVVTGGSSYLYENVTVTQSFWWINGHLYGDAVVTCNPLAHLVEDGGSASYTSCKFFFLEGAEWTSGNYKMNGGSEFNFPNGADFLINLSTALGISQNGGTPLGTINLTPGSILTKGGAGKAALGVVFNSQESEIDVEGGGLDLFRGTHHQSHFFIKAGLAMQCTNNGNLFYESEISGLGIFRETGFYSVIDSATTLDCHLEITGGNLQVNCPITPLSLKMTGGELSGTGEITVNGNCDWTGPTLITGTGLIDVRDFTTMSGSGGRTFRKEIKMNGGGSWGGNFYLNFGSTGILRVPAGATLTLSPTTTINNVGTQNATCGIILEGNLVKTTNFEFDFQGADLDNQGSVEGIGTFRTWNYAFIHPNTGALSAGVPGTPGTLKWSGHFENKASGNLVFDFVKDPNTGIISFDQIAFLNNLTLGGTLTVTGAEPCWENGSWDIISWVGTRTGSFANVVLPPSYELVIDDVAKKIRITHTNACPGMNRPEQQELNQQPASEERSGGSSADIEFSVFPVPATDVLNVEFELASEASVRLEFLNASGQQVYAEFMETTSANQYAIPVAEIPNGIYFLNLQIGSERLIRKVLIERG